METNLLERLTEVHRRCVRKKTRVPLEDIYSNLKNKRKTHFNKNYLETVFSMTRPFIFMFCFCGKVNKVDAVKKS